MRFKKLKRFYVAGIILVVGLVVGGGVWWWSWGGESEVVSGDEVEVVDETEIADGEEIDTSDWKTYTSTLYGYKITFPPEYKFVVGVDEKLVPDIPSDKIGVTLSDGTRIIDIVPQDTNNIDDYYNLARFTLEEVVFGKNIYTQIKRQDLNESVGYYGDYVINNSSKNIIIILSNFKNSVMVEKILELFEYPKE